MVVLVSDREQLLHDFGSVRALSLRLAAPLQPDEWRVQSMPDVSPPYWNLGHTSWFFARNVLAPAGRELQGFPGFDYAFNSYYEGLGPRLPRERRGAVAEPDTAATLAFRAAVDAAMAAALTDLPEAGFAEFAAHTRIGLQHEQQHQELLLTEILHIRGAAPAAGRRPYLAAAARAQAGRQAGGPPAAVDVAGGVVEIGHRDGGFCWDNELPVHRAVVPDCAVADRLVTNAEWLAFVADGGYRQPLLWLANGWEAVRSGGWRAPLYWEERDGRFLQWTLRGLVELEPGAPVSHVSFYEAEAFARWYGEQWEGWRGARLPFEREWEHAARAAGFVREGANLLDDDVAGSALAARPAVAARPGALRQLCGDLWEWTLSHYEPFPGYRPFAGALMEYNGKFMDNQRVLRGGSFATPRTHARVAYRNFWAPATRFQATGVRLLTS